MVEDINVCEDRKGYCLVALVSGYVLVHFFLSKEGEGMEKKRVQCGVPPVPDVKFVPENEYKLFNPSVPEGYVIFPIPTSGLSVYPHLRVLGRENTEGRLG